MVAIEKGVVEKGVIAIKKGVVASEKAACASGARCLLPESVSLLVLTIFFKAC